MEIRTIKQNNEQEGRVIRKLHIAQDLLELGNTIIGLKTDRTDPDGKRVVYIFKNDAKFQEDMTKVMDANRQRREESFEERVAREVEKRMEKIAEMNTASVETGCEDA